MGQRQLGFAQYEALSVIGRWDPEHPIISPNDVRVLIESLPNPITVIIDEFDRLPIETDVRRLMADTIKVLSDRNLSCTIFLVGVGQSIGQLIDAHESISRNVDYVPVDPMEPSDLALIIQKGMSNSNMTYDQGLDLEVAHLSQGYPHYTHLLGREAGIQALFKKRQHVTNSDLGSAIEPSIEAAAGGIRLEYDTATDSTQPKNLFKEVLLALRFSRQRHSRSIYAGGNSRTSSADFKAPSQNIFIPKTPGSLLRIRAWI